MKSIILNLSEFCYKSDLGTIENKPYYYYNYVVVIFKDYVDY